MRISILYLGHIECNRYHLIECKNKEEMIKSPISAILIEHPVLGNLLYDTGNSPFYSSVHPDSVKETYPIPEFISIEDALKERGMKPSDIDSIILSHLHFDHAGGLQYFKGMKALENVLVAEEELKNAYYQVMTGHGGAYVKSLFDIDGIIYHTITEDMDLADDVRLIIQKSHTPAVTGMVLKTKSKGNIIMPSDTIYTRESYEKGLPPGGPINKTKQEFYDNLDKIKHMAVEYSAELLFGHDYGQIMEWSMAGKIE